MLILAKKVSRKAAAAAAKQEKLSNITFKVVACVLLFAAGFVIGCAASARSVYNSKVDKESVNAIEEPSD